MSCAQSRMKNAYHHGDLRNALITEGMKLLELRDGESFTLRDLARRVNVSQAALYSHFEDKSALLAAMAAAGFDRLAENLEASSLGEGKVAERSLSMGEAYVRFGMDNPALYRLMFTKDYCSNGGGTGEAFSRFMVQIRRMDSPQCHEPYGYGLSIWAYLHGLTSLHIFERETKKISCNKLG